MVIKLTQLRALYSRNAHRFPIYSNGSWDPQWTCSQKVRFDSQFVSLPRNSYALSLPCQSRCHGHGSDIS